MNTADIIEVASSHLRALPGHIFDVLTLSKPVSPEAAINLARVVSKLSPLLGNLIEFNTVEILNEQTEFHPYGKWIRQDPGFPDAVFQGSIEPTPGFEIKAWFPLATEITARFKDSQNRFSGGNTYVALLAWLPEYVIYGRPRILGVCILEGGSVARARDSHYHRPPDYLVLEPGDTRSRTRNLQQTNTNGYKWQGTPEQFAEAQQMVAGWGPDGRTYRPTPEYQELLRQLLNRYSYRLDTNYAKIDRIFQPEIEEFKQRIYNTPVHGMTVREWLRLHRSTNDDAIGGSFARYLNITDQDAEALVK